MILLQESDSVNDVDKLLLLSYAREFSIVELREHLESIEDILLANKLLKLTAANTTTNRFEKCLELDQALLDAVAALQELQPEICAKTISSAAIRNTLKRILLYSFELRERLLLPEAEPT